MATSIIKSDVGLKAALKAISTGKADAGRISDGGGLYLLPLVKGGAHCWRLDYTIEGRRKTISLGTYPDTGLALARQKAADARALVAAGTDPSAARQAVKTAREQQRQQDEEARRLEAAGLPPPGSLQAVAADWLAHRAGKKWAPVTLTKIDRSLELHVYPTLGRSPIADVTAADIRACVQGIEAAGASETAGRVFQRLRALYRHALSHDLVQADPTYSLKPSEIFRGHKARHRPAMTIQEAPAFLRKLQDYGGELTVRCALLLLVLTAVRPGELRGARWEEIDTQAALWRIPAPRMKMKAEHLVPLSKQALAVLDEIRPLTGYVGLIFPSPYYPGKPISENTLNSALARMGYKGAATAHGMRTLFSTAANEAGHRSDAIERQLSHEERDDVRAAYNRAAYMPERRQLMDWWGDRIDALRRGGQVLRFCGRGTT